MKHSVTAVTFCFLCVGAQAQQFARLQQFERRFLLVQRNHSKFLATTDQAQQYGLLTLIYQSMPGGSGLKASVARLFFPHGKEGLQSQTFSGSATWSHTESGGTLGSIDLHTDYQMDRDEDPFVMIANLDSGISTGAGPDLTPSLIIEKPLFGGDLVPSLTTAYQFGDTSAFVGSGSLQWFPNSYLSFYLGGSPASRATGASNWNAGMLYSLDGPNAPQQRTLVLEYDQGRIINVGISWKFPYISK